MPARSGCPGRTRSSRSRFEGRQRKAILPRTRGSRLDAEASARQSSHLRQGRDRRADYRARAWQRRSETRVAAPSHEDRGDRRTGTVMPPTPPTPKVGAANAGCGDPRSSLRRRDRGKDDDWVMLLQQPVQPQMDAWIRGEHVSRVFRIPWNLGPAGKVEGATSGTPRRPCSPARPSRTLYARARCWRCLPGAARAELRGGGAVARFHGDDAVYV